MEYQLFYFQFCENSKPFFPCSGKYTLLFPKCGRFKLYFPHCGKYHKVLTILWKLSMSLPQNYLYNCDSPHFWSFGAFLPHFLNWAYIFSEDFHKSFRNLPNFFRKHARGAHTIFHLCLVVIHLWRFSYLWRTSTNPSAICQISSALSWILS